MVEAKWACAAAPLAACGASQSFQDRVFDTDLLGETKVTNNIEMLLSTTVFF